MNAAACITFGLIATLLAIVMLGPLGVLAGGNAAGWIVALTFLGTGAILTLIGIIGLGVRVGQRDSQASGTRNLEHRQP